MIIELGSMGVSECIKLIAQELIKRADDITRDLNHVTSIKISADITPEDIINFDVTKNYAVFNEESEKNEISENIEKKMTQEELEKIKGDD